MFDFIRSNKRWMQFVLLLLIVPSFVFFGVEGYSRFSQSDQALAQVGDQSVELARFEEMKKQRAEELQAQLKGQFNPALLDEPRTKQLLLNELIDELVLGLIVKDNFMTASDAQIQQQIVQMPFFFNENGVFDKKVYEDVLKQNNLTPAAYEASIRASLAAASVYSPVLQTGRLPQTVLTRFINDVTEVRTAQNLFLPFQDFVSQVKVDDASVKSFFDKNSALFKTVEKVDVQFLALDPLSLSANVSVSDDEAKTYFQKNAASYVLPEQRLVSHIFFNFPEDAKAKAALKKKVEGIAQQVAAQPGSFAAFVKKYSEDTGSVEKGGALDWFARDGIDKAIADEAFKMKKGQVSKVVESASGFHILLLNEIRSKTQRPFEEVAAEIKSQLFQQKMGDIFQQKSKQFNDLVYSQPNSLEPAAKQLGLTIQTVKGLTRQGGLAQGSPFAQLFSAPQVMGAVFSPSVLTNKQNSGVLTLENGTMVALRVQQHFPAVIPQLDTIKEQVKAVYVRTKALELANAAGKAKLAALKKADSTAGFSMPMLVSHSSQNQVSGIIINAVMGANVDTLPAFVGLEVPNAGYVVIRISHTEVPKNIPQQAIQGFQEQLAARLAASEQRALAKMMRDHYKVTLTDLGKKTVGEVPQSPQKEPAKP